MKCSARCCPECGDNLIHQYNRRGRESSSALGQHIQDTYPHDFDFMDIDGVIAKKETKLIRIVEHKQLSGTVKPSQRRVLPIMACGIDALITAGTINQQSGVFVVYSDPPFNDAYVRRIHAAMSYRTDAPVHMDMRAFETFKRALE